MELTVKTTGKDQYRDKIKMLVTGPSGSGKTPFAATAPNVLFADCQGGLMSIADRAVPFVTITSEADLIAVKNLLNVDDAQRAKTFGRPIDTLVLDTGDEFGRILLAERMMTERRSEATGGDYGFVGQRLHTVIEVLTGLPVNVIVLTHYREMGKDDDVRIMKPGFAGQFADQCGQYFDYSVFASSRVWSDPNADDGPKEYETRYLQVRPDQTKDFLFDRSHRLPAEFELNFVDDFERIQALVKRDDIPESASMTIEVPDEVRSRPQQHNKSASNTPPQRPAKAPEPSPAPTPPPVAAPVAVTTVAAAVDEGDPFAKVDPPSPPTETPVAVDDTTSAVTTTNIPCKDCGNMIETEHQEVMAQLRYREPLCTGCFNTRRNNE